MKKHDSIAQQIIDTCQLPKDVLSGAAVISMIGNTEILVENFKNIITYQSEVLILQCKKDQIQISGKNLELEFYTKEEIKIRGIISQICFL